MLNLWDIGRDWKKNIGLFLGTEIGTFFVKTELEV